MARPSTAAVRLLSGEKEPVRVATTTNTALNGLRVIDGVQTAVGDRVLVKSQANKRFNGIYDVGLGSWYRSSDARSGRAIQKGVTVYVQEGLASAGVTYRFDTLNPVIGTTEIDISAYLSENDLVSTKVNRLVHGQLALQNTVVFGIAGQSNAIGANTDGGGDLTLNPSVFVYRPSTGTIEVADPTKSPFLGSNNNAGWQAAKRYQVAHGGNVLLVVVAQGSTSITEFLPGGSLWTRMTTDVPAALALVGQQYVDRWFWLQGEADQAQTVKWYKNRFEQFLANMKAQSWWLAGHTYMIGSEMVQARTNSSQGQGFAMRLVAETTADFVMISSYGAQVDPAQSVHYSGAGLDEMGKRFCGTASLPYGHAPRPGTPRFARGNLNFIVDSAGTDPDADFSDLFEALIFFSSIRLMFGVIANVTVKGQHNLIGASVQLSDLTGFVFQGVLVGGFTQPVKGDISATEATARSHLQSKYLTEITIATKLFVLGGNNGGTWKDILLTQTGSAGAISGAILSQEGNNNPTRSQACGSIRLHNIAFHRWQGTLSGAIYATRSDHVETLDCVFSHCSTAITAANGAFVEAPNAVIAQTTKGIDASYRATVNALSVTTDSSAANFYSARLGAYVDARSAENKVNKQELTNGIVET